MSDRIAELETRYLRSLMERDARIWAQRRRAVENLAGLDDDGNVASSRSTAYASRPKQLGEKS